MTRSSSNPAWAAAGAPLIRTSRTAIMKFRIRTVDCIGHLPISQAFGIRQPGPDPVECLEATHYHRCLRTYLLPTISRATRRTSEAAGATTWAGSLTTQQQHRDGGCAN